MGVVQYLLEGLGSCQHSGQIWIVASTHIMKGTNGIAVDDCDLDPLLNPHLQEKTQPPSI